MTRLSNLDLSGNIVRRGRVVSYYGLRFHVVKVHMGYLWGRQLAIAGVPSTNVMPKLQCGLVQVVPT